LSRGASMIPPLLPLGTVWGVVVSMLLPRLFLIPAKSPYVIFLPRLVKIDQSRVPHHGARG
jgi:hypothetical protein